MVQHKHFIRILFKYYIPFTKVFPKYYTYYNTQKQAQILTLGKIALLQYFVNFILYVHVFKSIPSRKVPSIIQTNLTVRIKNIDLIK